MQVQPTSDLSTYTYWSVCGGRKRFIAPTWIFLPAGLLAGWLAWQLGWSAGVNTITGNIFNPSHTILAWVQSYTAELDQVSARKNVRGQLMEHVSMVLKNPWNLIQILTGHAVKQSMTGWGQVGSVLCLVKKFCNDHDPNINLRLVMWLFSDKKSPIQADLKEEKSVQVSSDPINWVCLFVWQDRSINFYGQSRNKYIFRWLYIYLLFQFFRSQKGPNLRYFKTTEDKKQSTGPTIKSDLSRSTSP